MQGGPETGLTPNIDEIVSSGLAAGGLGAGTDTTTRSTPGVPKPSNPLAPQGGGVDFDLSVSSPNWSSQPSQEDLGQVDVRRGNYDTGMVTTPRLQLPFAALANRQIANQQRQAALEKQVADFNIYAGAGKAHDRYQSAFSKWSTGYIGGKVNELAKAFGGDRSKAIEYLRSTPDGRSMLNQWGSYTNAVGLENKEWVDTAVKSLAEVQSGKFYMPPEQRAKVEAYAQSLGPDLMPVEGATVEEFIPKMRDAGGALRENQYISEVIAPSFDDAMRTLTGVDFSKKRMGGKLVLTTTEKKGYDQAIDYLVNNSEDYVDTYHGGDKEKARKALESFFPTSVKETVNLESPMTYGSNGNGAGSGGDQKYRAVYNAVGIADPAMKPIVSTLRAAKANIPASAERLDQVILQDLTDGTGRPPSAMRLADNRYIYPSMVVRDQDERLWIVGKVAKEKDSRAVNPGSSMGIRGGEPQQMQFDVLEDIAVPYAQNKGVLLAGFPGLDETVIRSIIDEGVSGLPKRAPKAAPAPKGKTISGF